MSLFGNICRKFESVCQDVDEVVNHESIKYIERQVVNVGENVMKFYSKLAQVIVTPLMDLEAEEINQQEESIPLEPVENQLVHESVDSKGTASVSECLLDFEETTSKTSESKCSSDPEETAPQASRSECSSDPEETASQTSGSEYSYDSEETASEASGSEYSYDSEETASGTSASECFSCTSSALYVSSASMPIASGVASSAIECNETKAEMGSNELPNEGVTIHSSSAITLHNNAIGIIKWYSDYLISTQIGPYGNCSYSLAPSMESFGSPDNYSCETTDLDKEAKNLSHQVELEGSCVMVEYTTPHDNVSCEAQKQPSYKKNILDALSSKKRLAREYKELAILHRDNATECCQGTTLRDSQTVQLSDSEWELL